MPARAIEDKIGRIDFPFSQFLGIESRVVLVGEGCRGIPSSVSSAPPLTRDANTTSSGLVQVVW